MSLQLVVEFLAWELIKGVVNMSSRKLPFSGFIIFLFLMLELSGFASAQSENAISGLVLDQNGPVPGAVVRIQATETSTLTDQAGHFILTNLPVDKTLIITAWASGYYTVGVQASPGDDIEIHIEPHTDADNPDYEWLPSTFHPGQGENQGCAECHASDQSSDPNGSLPVDEWLLDAHSQAASNPRFLTMYLGQDLQGNQSPQTRFGNSRDYGRFPLRPDPSQPFYGPGYKLDFPETAGNCAACHTPAASVNNPYGVDPTTVAGVPAEGLPCDFCHKIWDVTLDEAGIPFPNMPGVLSFEFRRPPEGQQFFAGPFDDVAPGEDTFSALQTQSEICAPCHFGVFWDTLVYNSFGEWLESPYSNSAAAQTAGLSESQTCQDCHMPPLGVSHFARADQGGLERDPEKIFSHNMTVTEELLQNAVSLEVEAEIQNGQLTVDVTIINDQTGHHVPTDSPLRQMILLIAATDSDGNSLAQVAGSTVPEWGGVGDPDAGYYSGVPGTAYAKILQEMWTEVTPTGAYWNPTRIISDNRIAALESDTTEYVFEISEVSQTSKILVDVKLLYRRAFIELIDQKSWDVSDILIEQETLKLSMGE